MRYVLVIGAAGGIGRGTVGVLLKHGFSPLAADVTFPELMSVPIFEVDVTDPASVDSLFTKIEEQGIELTGVVNLSGIIRDRTLLKMEKGQWDQVIDVNLTGSFNVVKRAALHMKQNTENTDTEITGGSMVFVGSTAALNGNFGQVNYAASKAGIQGLVRSAARELGRYGIRVNCVIPGFIDTKMTQSIPEERVEALKRTIPLHRAGSPEEVGNLIEFLISDRSSYITGASILVDGGMRM